MRVWYLYRSTYIVWFEEIRKCRSSRGAQNSQNRLDHRTWLNFCRGLVILVAIVFGGWLFWTGPTDPYANFTPEQMIQAAATRTPIQSLRLWQMLERSGLEHHKRWEEIAFEDIQAGYQVLWWVLGYGRRDRRCVGRGGNNRPELKRKKQKQRRGHRVFELMFDRILRILFYCKLTNANFKLQIEQT